MHLQYASIVNIASTLVNFDVQAGKCLAVLMSRFIETCGKKSTPEPVTQLDGIMQCGHFAQLNCEQYVTSYHSEHKCDLETVVLVFPLRWRFCQQTIALAILSVL